MYSHLLKKRKFGLFECANCKRSWQSGYTYPGTRQQCLSCKTFILPKSTKPLDRSLGRNDPYSTHPQDGCEMCKKIGNHCSDAPVNYTSDLGESCSAAESEKISDTDSSENEWSAQIDSVKEPEIGFRLRKRKKKAKPAKQRVRRRLIESESSEESNNSSVESKNSIQESENSCSDSEIVPRPRRKLRNRIIESQTTEEEEELIAQIPVVGSERESLTQITSWVADILKEACNTSFSAAITHHCIEILRAIQSKELEIEPKSIQSQPSEQIEQTVTRNLAIPEAIPSISRETTQFYSRNDSDLENDEESEIVEKQKDPDYEVGSSQENAEDMVLPSDAELTDELSSEDSFPEPDSPQPASLECESVDSDMDICPAHQTNNKLMKSFIR